MVDRTQVAYLTLLSEQPEPIEYRTCRSVVHSFQIFLLRLFKSTTTQKRSQHSNDTVSELTRRSATSNYEWRTCPRSLCGG